MFIIAVDVLHLVESMLHLIHHLLLDPLQQRVEIPLYFGWLVYSGQLDDLGVARGLTSEYLLELVL